MKHSAQSGSWVSRGLTTAVAFGLAALSVVASAPAAQAQDQSPARCSTALTVGMQTLNLTVDGVARTAQVYVPTSALRSVDVKGAPVLLALHGSNNTTDTILDISDLKAAADRHGNILVAPQGSVPGRTAGYWAWNVPGVTNAPAGTPDDVHFLKSLVDTVVTSYCGDPSKVFATGWSGGGRMISAAACLAPGIFAAIAPVDGLRAGVPVQDASGAWVPDTSTCSPTRGTPVITFSGTADPINPATGGGAAYWQYSAAQAVAGWLTINECRDSATVRNGLVTRTFGLHCDEPVVSYVIDGMGHTWPGGNEQVQTEAAAILGAYSDAVDANDVMWRFFRSVA